MNRPGLFLSWVDVSRWLWECSCQKANKDAFCPPPPDGLVFARAYWDSLQLGIAAGTDQRTITQWLERCLESQWDNEAQSILLDGGAPGMDNRLPVEWEELSEEEKQDWQDIPFRPRFSPPETVHFPKKTPLYPEKSHFPPIIVFHSFKGGVGRTLFALALTQAYAYKPKNKKVLLVDADFEAPGISFLFQERRPDIDFSLADLLIMAHGDPDPEASQALEKAAKKLAAQQLGNIFVLPCFRDMKGILSLEIRPDHLTASTVHSPFFLTELLSRLGEKLGVDVVIIDLRAGFSELSAAFLLDPRVNRVLVSTASGQAIQGTKLLMGEMGRLAKNNHWENGNLPALILNHLPPGLLFQKDELGWNKELDDILEEFNHSLDKSFSALLTEEEASSQRFSVTEEGMVHALIPYDLALAMLSKKWERTMETIRKTRISEILWEKLEGWLPEIDPSPHRNPPSLDDLDKRRDKLSEFAGNLIVAEGDPSDQISFLVIQPLLKLAEDHLAKVPVIVSVGGKGAGKTYTFLKMAHCRTWDTFVEKISFDLVSRHKSHFFPLLWSKNANTAKMMRLQNMCKMVVGLPQENDGNPFELSVKITQFQKNSPSIWEWRSFWVDSIAWSLGLNPGEPGMAVKLIKHLRKKKVSLIVIVDGLEENFQKFSSEESQQTALTALLQEVPEWLRTQFETPLGLIVFVREDMVKYAIPQNRTQFLERYKKYILQWRWSEALELSAWLTEKSGAEKGVWTNEFSNFSGKEQTRSLKPLWGNKLGHDYSNEGKSNNWVLSALSDLKGRIQARDVVRFISFAAEKSMGYTKMTDRLLAPSAIRGAIKPCSIEKTGEIGEENPPLKSVFEKIKNRGTDSSFSTPCTFAQLSELGLDQNGIDLMEQNGILFLDKEGTYHFPEIFRYGLNIDSSAIGRRKVISLMRQARNQWQF